MRLLCVANWSEGRDADTLAAMRNALHSGDAAVHYDGADPDHNRIVTAFSGSPDAVRDCLFAIADSAFSRIDMRRHEGVHPRIGALDVCPFILLDGDDAAAHEFAAEVGSALAEQYDLPVFLYEKSETGKHSADLPSLRKGQFEGLLGRWLDPDFGPESANPRLGAAVVGLRDWLLAVNVNLPADELHAAKATAREIRILRDQGDPAFAGVRSLGLNLKRRGMSQVSMNLTRPDETRPDTVFGYINERHVVLGTELIGVIRPKDLPGATAFAALPQQVVS